MSQRWLCWMVLVCLLGSGACGDDAAPSTVDGGHDDAGGYMNRPDSGPGPVPMRPQIPAARFESCSALAPQYAGNTCTQACANVRCPCEPWSTSYVACHPDRGCLTSLNCDVACERDLGDVVGCLGDYAPCEKDSDCANDGRCVKTDGMPGDCTSGVPGAGCLDDGDCRDGSCVATSSNGTRTCQSGISGATCNVQDECDSGLSCVLPKSSFVGTCSDRK